MKWSFVLNLSFIRRTVQRLAQWTREFGLLMTVTICFFVVLGLGAMVQAKTVSPVSSMKGLAAALTSDFFIDMVGMEVPGAGQSHQKTSLSQEKIGSFLFQFLTNINPHDPKTLLAHEVPGMAKDQPILLRQGKGTDPSASPFDYVPPVSTAAPDGVSTPKPVPLDQAGKAPANGGAKPDTGNKKVVFIYHTHDQESWLPELKQKGVKKLNQAFDSKINVTLLGKRLSEKLEDKGIGAEYSNTSYENTVSNFNSIFAYKYSSKTVKDAFATNPNIQFVFDLHRDSLERSRTTTTINGADYAQIFFIIGHKNPNWRKNEEFATQIHNKLEEKTPGISKGIWGKNANDGNAEYNQSLWPNSVLIEIGGPENTLEESYRTIDLLSDVIADMYWDAEKVNGTNKGSAA